MAGANGRSLLARLTPYLLLVSLTAPSCGGGDDGTSLPSSVAVGEVLQEERVFVDPSRPTRANGNAPASEQRTLATRLWYAPTALDAPACGRDGCALVVLAHGFGGRTSRFDAIARSLAAVGYIVAAPSFPLTNQDTPGNHLNGLNDVVQQPGDISVVIDEILHANEEPDDALYRRVDGERIGAVGHSLGGSTVIAATRSSCCTDARIDAALLVAPAAFVVESFFGAPPNPEGPPQLVVNGADDPLISPESSLAYAQSAQPPWYFLQIRDVGHVFLIENIGDPLPPLHVTERAARAFFDEYLGGTDGSTAEGLQQLAAEGEEVELSE
jgi:dienelactone hydrolase